MDYLSQKTIMTGPYYSEVLTNLRQTVKEKRRGILTRGPLLQHDNAPTHMSQVAQAIVKDGVVILCILYCSLGRYERHISVRQAAVVSGACGALCPYWSVLV